MKHYPFDKDDFAQPAQDMSLPSLVVGNGMAYLFHYHIYNVTVDDLPHISPDQVNGECYHRIVFSDDPLTSLSDVSALWDAMVDKLHFYEKLYIKMVDFDSMFVATCTNCGEPDVIFMLEECKLCNSPLCQTCHHSQNYCDSHLN